MNQKSEKRIQDEVCLAASARGYILFRNNQGMAIVGKTTFYPSGDALVRGARRIRYGVCNPGGSDLIGWNSVIITPDMVGQRVAVFTGLEIKKATGRASKPQKNFIDKLTEAGGIAAVVRGVEDIP